MEEKQKRLKDSTQKGRWTEAFASNKNITFTRKSSRTQSSVNTEKFGISLQCLGGGALKRDRNGTHEKHCSQGNQICTGMTGLLEDVTVIRRCDGKRRELKIQ